MKLLPFDLSKPPHRETIDLFMPFIPGIFFGLSVFWGRPDLKASYFQATAELGYYGRVTVAVFLAYFIGMVVSIFTSFLLTSLKWSYRKDAYRLIQTENRVLYKYLGKKGQSKSWFLNKIVRPLYHRWLLRQMMKQNFRSAAIQVWGAAADKLLRSKFGISPPSKHNAGTQWAVWRILLGTPSAAQIRGNSFVRAMYAAGWLGLLAAKIAPPLRTHYYYGISLALLFVGLIQDLTLARNFGDPTYEVFTQTLAVLNDLQKANDETKSTPPKDEGAGNTDDEETDD